ncbi:MAG TPA: hypothetical protein VMF07_11880 [Solirubrobacteraceae bacterium]|nr:hypothetical protein [Solirubrobacteraceae bacterium]
MQSTSLGDRELNARLRLAAEKLRKAQAAHAWCPTERTAAKLARRRAQLGALLAESSSRPARAA